MTGCVSRERYRLSRFFNMSDGFWIGLQVDDDAAMAKDALVKVLAKIKPWTVVEQHGENDTEPGAAAAGSRRGRTR